MRPRLVVVAKQPEPGKVKTRIAAVLGDENAIELARCALHDTLTFASRVAGVEVLVSYAPATEAAKRYFERVAPNSALLPQRGATLGERIRDIAASAQRDQPIVMIGSDSPDLPADYIERAFALLSQQADVVLGPADDGGYYLIGVNSPHPCLFERIDWSTSVVAQQTRVRARDARLRLVELPQWHDLDTVEDLEKLVPPGAPLTRAFIAQFNDKVKT